MHVIPDTISIVALYINPKVYQTSTLINKIFYNMISKFNVIDPDVFTKKCDALDNYHYYFLNSHDERECWKSHGVRVPQMISYDFINYDSIKYAHEIKKILFMQPKKILFMSLYDNRLLDYILIKYGSSIDLSYKDTKWYLNNYNVIKKLIDYMSSDSVIRSFHYALKNKNYGIFKLLCRCCKTNNITIPSNVKYKIEGDTHAYNFIIKEGIYVPETSKARRIHSNVSEYMVKKICSKNKLSEIAPYILKNNINTDYFISGLIKINKTIIDLHDTLIKMNIIKFMSKQHLYQMATKYGDKQIMKNVTTIYNDKYLLNTKFVDFLLLYISTLSKIKFIKPYDYDMI
jgi:hypothetical protein